MPKFIIRLLTKGQKCDIVILVKMRFGSEAESSQNLKKLNGESRSHPR